MKGEAAPNMTKLLARVFPAASLAMVSASMIT